MEATRVLLVNVSNPVCGGAEPLPRVGTRLPRRHAQPRARRRGRGAARRGRGRREHPRLATPSARTVIGFAELQPGEVLRRTRSRGRDPGHHRRLPCHRTAEQSDKGHERRCARRRGVRALRARRALPRARLAAAGQVGRDRGFGLLGRRRAGPDPTSRGGGQEGEGPRRAAHGRSLHDAGPAALQHADFPRLSLQLHFLRLDPVLAQHPLLLARVHDGGDQAPPRHLRRQVHHLPR